MTSLIEKSVVELSTELTQKTVSSVDVAKAYLKEIETTNDEFNILVETYDDVLDQAKQADKRRASGEQSALLGIPFVLKDNILIEGKIAAAGSHILDNYSATYDSTVVRKLKEEGALFIGRGNMDDSAMGSSTESSFFGATKNPHDPTRVPGGSSGGPAAAIAANFTPVSLGSDTGGSIRQPAGFCGCVGLKPTYGAVSRYGLIALGSSLDQIGPLTRTVTDNELVFKIIRGNDPMDSTTLPDRLEMSDKPKKKMTIGIPRDFFGEGVDADVRDTFEKTLKALEAIGHTVIDITLPNAKYALAAYYIILPAEVSTNHARLDGLRYGQYEEGTSGIDDYFVSRGRGFGAEVRRRILLGTYVLSAGYYDAFYGKAHGARAVITRDFNDAFERVDVVATPTSPTPAFKIGEKTDPLSMYLEDIFTVPANITGMPALSVPMGFVKRNGNDLPTGFQLLAPHEKEDRLFAVGKDIEQIN